LEIGYGAGAVLLAVSSIASELHGLDLDTDPEQVAPVLRARGCEASLKQGDVLKMPYEDGFFDIVICFSVFEHLHEYRRALAEVARVLRPGGAFVLGMPAVSKAMSWGFRAIGFEGIDHHHVTSPSEVARAFDGAGLRVRDTRYLGLHLAPLYTVWRLTKGE